MIVSNTSINKTILLGLAVLLALPILLVLTNVVNITSESWYHLSQNLLPTYIKNTLLVVFGVGFVTLILGVSSAWCVAMYDFPFRKKLEWLLILPLSIPTFINGITYSGLTDFTGPIRVFLRSVGVGDVRIDVLNIWGVILVMGFVLYPYVYLTSRAAFSFQSGRRIEAARLLGANEIRTFFKVALPIAWPGIFAGLMLVLMEVLNDYGTVHYYGVSTFTVGIFKSWLSLGDISSAVLLSLFLIAFVGIILFIDNRIRGRKRFQSEGKRLARTAILGNRRRLVLVVCFIPLFFGFVIPLAQLIYWLTLSYDRIRIEDLFQGLGGTAQVALITGVFLVSLAWFFNFISRKIKPKGLWRLPSKLALLGYSMPGAVVGIGVVGLVLAINPDWLFAGIIALILGYTTRFFAVGSNPIESGYEKLPLSLDESSRMLGKKSFSILSKIHFPLIRPVLLAAFIMVFIDITKELPLTLILRPFNFETLATQAFQFATDEMAAQSAAPSLMIVLISAVPVYFLQRIFGGS